MLLCVRDRPTNESPVHASLQRQFSHGHGGSPGTSGGVGTRVSHFLPTSRRIVQFSNGKGPRPDARIVYMDGAFDLFHAGHVEVLSGRNPCCAVRRHVMMCLWWVSSYEVKSHFSPGGMFFIVQATFCVSLWFYCMNSILVSCW